MTGDKALHISNCIAAYNKVYGHPRNGHRSFCKIEEFVEYPETQKNGANFALKFKTNLNDCTLEYKDFNKGRKNVALVNKILHKRGFQETSFLLYFICKNKRGIIWKRYMF